MPIRIVSLDHEHISFLDSPIEFVLYNENFSEIFSLISKFNHHHLKYIILCSSLK